MRNLATEPKEAYKHLGPENGQAFIGLVADFRAALFAGDVPGGPASVKRNGKQFELGWFIFSGCTWKTVVLAAGDGTDEAWKDAHRIRLESVTHGKVVLA
jgi:hypothetical protein